MEQSLERGETIANQLFRIRNAHKDGNIYPVTPPFPEHKCPDTIPDLADHNNLCARALRVRPDAYHRYKSLSTGGGVPFSRCLKTAVDIKGEYGTKYCGIIAGDEECYKLFREIFDPVIEMRHNFPLGQKHSTNWDVDAVRGVPLDPDGKCALWETNSASLPLSASLCLSLPLFASELRHTCVPLEQVYFLLPIAHCAEHSWVLSPPRLHERWAPED